MTPFEQALEVIGTKGADLMQEDMETIEALSIDFPPDDFVELMAIIDEAVSLIVNDPDYEGDIPPIE